MIIADKCEMYAKLRAGYFGNTAQTWTTYTDLVASTYRGLLGIRSLVPGGPFSPYIPFTDAPKGNFIYSEMQEDAFIILQGEVYLSTEGLYLYASKVQTHMRSALKQGGKQYYRLSAKYELQAAMWPSDYDALQELLDLYPDSVIEFSAYDKAVGTISNRNTIIWEVRNY